ncbi:MAG: hypothetical protein ACJ8IR_07525 [Alphaproteobacteria bacterium]|jgi:hypothetical protein
MLGGKFAPRQLSLRLRHQRFRFATPLRDVTAELLALTRVVAVLQPVAIAERRSNPWVPHILWPQYLDR